MICFCFWVFLSSVEYVIFVTFIKNIYLQHFLKVSQPFIADPKVVFWGTQKQFHRWLRSTSEESRRITAGVKFTLEMDSGGFSVSITKKITPGHHCFLPPNSGYTEDMPAKWWGLLIKELMALQKGGKVILSKQVKATSANYALKDLEFKNSPNLNCKQGDKMSFWGLFFLTHSFFYL